MIDALALEAAGAAMFIVVGTALRYRKPAIRSLAPPPLFAITRSVRALRRRHRRIGRSIVALARECLERHPEGSFEAFTARETLRTYLPETLAAYFSVPKALRRVRRPAGPSADDELGRQLWMLHSGLERIREADAEIGAARMTANAAFLGERFASADSFGTPARRRSMLGEFAGAIESTLRRH